MARSAGSSGKTLNSFQSMSSTPAALKLAIASAADEQLVAWSKEGHSDAFEELVHRHRDKIYARAMIMMRNEVDATDIAQEAWVKGWRRLHQFQGDSSFTTWMTRITINLCLDQIRKQKRVRAESIDELDEEAGGVERLMPVEDVNPTEGMEADEVRKRIDEALAKLSDAHRTVVVMHEFDGLEYKEIAKRVGISIGTVMSRLFYARRRLATLLQNLRRDRSE